MSIRSAYYRNTMTTITIPKALANDKNLVAVPRATYEEFLAWQRRLKSRRTFVPTARELKALARGRKNFARGKYVTLDELEHDGKSSLTPMRGSS